MSTKADKSDMNDVIEVQATEVKPPAATGKLRRSPWWLLVALPLAIAVGAGATWAVQSRLSMSSKVVGSKIVILDTEALIQAKLSEFSTKTTAAEVAASSDQFGRVMREVLNGYEAQGVTVLNKAAVLTAGPLPEVTAQVAEKMNLKLTRADKMGAFAGHNVNVAGDNSAAAPTSVRETANSSAPMAPPAQVSTKNPMGAPHRAPEIE
jgi:hypothetical protein